MRAAAAAAETTAAAAATAAKLEARARVIEEVEEKEREPGEGADLLGEVGGEGLSDQRS